MSRSLFALSVLFVLGACQSVDEHMPCTGDADLRGRLCREVISVGDEPIGQVEVSYPTSNTVERLYRTVAGDVTRTTTEVYQSGRLLSITQDAEDGVKRAVFAYDTTDSLRSVMHYSGTALDSSVTIDYALGRRVLETVSGKGSRAYVYYDDGMGPLYRLVDRDTAGTTLRYSQYEYYGTGQTRIEHRLADHTSDGHTLLTLGPGGRTEQATRFSALGDTMWAISYSYTTDGRLVRRLTEQTGPDTASDFLYY
jgi:hypothetical protein